MVNMLGSGSCHMPLLWRHYIFPSRPGCVVKQLNVTDCDDYMTCAFPLRGWLTCVHTIAGHADHRPVQRACGLTRAAAEAAQQAGRPCLWRSAL
jgi:hypothetical protein